MPDVPEIEGLPARTHAPGDLVLTRERVAEAGGVVLVHLHPSGHWEVVSGDGDLWTQALRRCEARKRRERLATGDMRFVADDVRTYVETPAGRRRVR